MCGITGYNLTSQLLNDNNGFSLALKESCRLISHRGPDNKDFFLNDNLSLGLGHTRLSIIDISSSANQPMISECKNFILIFNGEIYNFNELKNELDFNSKKKYPNNWKTNSDTEVLLKYYISCFSENIKTSYFLNKLNGIFSLAIFNKITNELIIARDSHGVKPLYISRSNKGIAFSSELKGLIPYYKFLHLINSKNKIEIDKIIDSNSINRYLHFLWSPGITTPLEKISKLSPGEFIVIKNGDLINKEQWYKSYSKNHTFFKGNRNKIVKEMDSLLRRAVHKQMISDVPLGAFLSGGVDSSAIVSYARELNPKINCFTIDNNENNISEDIEYSKRVAKILNVNLEIVSVAPKDLITSIKEMVWQLDEPLADPACINVLFISQLARSMGIKVLLSGAGGDDLFTGYRRHIAVKQDKFISLIPSNIKRKLLKSSILSDANGNMFRRIKKILSLPNLKGNDMLINHFKWINKEDLYKLYTNEFKQTLNDSQINYPMEEYLNELPNDLPNIEKMLALEKRFFLTDHNLNYTDKMSMQHGVEVRVPFLENELVEFASKVPIYYKLRGNETKWILKKTLEKYLPKKIIYRKKEGFGLPIRGWLRNELFEWSLEVLSKDSLDKRGIFNSEKVHELIHKNASGIVDYSYTIFSIICIEMWFSQFLDRLD